MKPIFTEIRLGAEPFELVHATDTHFSYGDERDGEKKIRHASASVNFWIASIS